MDRDAIALRDATGFPGMRILHYAFDGGADNPHLPHNHPENAVVYPGNHDNDTTAGWWRGLRRDIRAHVRAVLGLERGPRQGGPDGEADDIAWDLNRAALASAARTAIVQMQDVVGLGGDARMNDPASYARPPSERRNWGWRLRPGEASPAAAERMRRTAALHGRLA
jgi:4-alpha-glucanotransferase